MATVPKSFGTYQAAHLGSEMVRFPMSTLGGRCRSVLATAFGILFSSTLVYAQGTVPSGEFDGRLAPGDQLIVTVFDQPDISGNYIIGADGTLALPLIGSMPAAALKPQELQQALLDRLGDGYLQKPVVNVRVAELRPVTVTGDVRTPGRFPFFNSMNMDTAAALAGGISRMTSEETVVRSEFLQADERLTTLRLDHMAMLVRQARLQAQMNQLSEFAPLAVDDHDPATLDRMMEGERAILTSEAKGKEQELQLLNQQVAQRMSEVKSLADQVDLENEQIALLDTQLGDFANLLKNGLTRKSMLIDIQREKNRSRSNLSRILGELTQSQAALAELELRVSQVDDSYRSRLAKEAQEVGLRLMEVESALPLAEEIRQLKFSRAPQLARTGTPPLKVTRYQDGKLETFKVDGATLVWPGDVLQVGEPYQMAPTPVPSSGVGSTSSIAAPVPRDAPVKPLS